MKDTHNHGSRPRRPLARLLCAMALAAPGLLAAQEPAAPAAGAGAKEMPRPDELEPGVNTTNTAPSAPAAAAAPAGASTPSAASAPAGTSSPAAATPAAPASTPAAGASTPASGSAPASKSSGARQNEAGAKTAARKSGPDRLELDATDITGNRELPKVLYIVPWKRSDLGDVVGKPVNSLLDEVLQPLDRDVFRRENRYYDGL
ncbi:MAG: hypothetical protein JO158_08590, partial [Gammaproteobacteria bacterium]|nr:hypothetical protein [Gammaproteobacteria bacterium]MBV9725604.1 hypothetical protein [Gammaproteobacteria bacterium]